jgi:predicted lipid-binding transport protein (Tim44 family)
LHRISDFAATRAARFEAEEMWTFVRRRGGTWLLSAIQQI